MCSQTACIFLNNIVTGLMGLSMQTLRKQDWTDSHGEKLTKVLRKVQM